jgi:V8-like Glu-specific endopeptidase
MEKGQGGNMKTNFWMVAIALISFSQISNQANASANQQPGSRVIYGNDDRKDLYEVTNPAYRKLSDSTVALVDSSNITQNSSGVLDIKAETLTDLMGVCSSEPYANQPSAAFCSGSLIGKNLILTAGHCITDQDECNHTKFIFGYDVNQKSVYPTQAKESETYSCKSIVHREQNGTGADFGIIELDRNVVGHEILKLADRSNSTIGKGEKLLMIGHPSGLPTKLDDGGEVRNPNPNGYFVATTDSYGGNSGSAVFNQKTGEIEGVLVRGENDFVMKGSCYVSNVCSETGCRGEDVTKISSIAPHIPTPL